MDPRALIGSWRRFGPVGPVYQVIDLGTEAPDGDRLMKVRLLETDQVTEYKLVRLLEDPIEA